MSETSMVERVARAIYAAHAFNDNHDSINPGFDGLSEDWREVMFASARAAIEALRNADNDMLAAMHRAMFTDPYDATNLPMLGAGFEAVIDAALSPNKETDR